MATSHSALAPTGRQLSNCGNTPVLLKGQTDAEHSWKEGVDEGGTHVLVAMVEPPHPPTMSSRRRLLNILGLSMGWCLMVSIIFIQLSTSTLAAKEYAGDSTSTLPAGSMMASATLTAIPGTLLMKRYGRRTVMLSTGLAAVLGSVFLCVAAQLRLLWLLCVASIPLGVCNAQANNLRFAAMEFSPAGWEAHAMSLVVLGAVLAAVVGPELARHTKDALPVTYVGTYILVTGLCVLYSVLVLVIEFHRTPDLVAEKAAAAAAEARRRQEEQEQREAADLAALVAGKLGVVGGKGAAEAERSDEVASGASSSAASVAAPPTQCAVGAATAAAPGPAAAGAHPGTAAAPQPPTPASLATPAAPAAPAAPAPARPLSELILSWRYLVPALAAGLSYGGMAGMMTASPLVIRDNGYSFDDATQVIQVHILCMFVPSLFTGEVVRLLGPLTTMTAGGAVLLAGTAAFFAGQRMPIFFVGNAVVGMGWNWAYVGASALVSTTYLPDEKFAAQGCMDMLVLLGTGLAGVLGGVLYGWLRWVGYTAVYCVVNGSNVVICAAYLVRLTQQRALAPELTWLRYLPRARRAGPGTGEGEGEGGAGGNGAAPEAVGRWASVRGSLRRSLRLVGV